MRTTERRRELIARLSLDEIDIRILTLRHIEHKSFAAISHEINMSPAQIGKRYKRALEALADAAERE
jgi:DNA-binding Lrp family transcriptional regulator